MSTIGTPKSNWWLNLALHFCESSYEVAGIQRVASLDNAIGAL
jgi:hypothetical protein